MKKIIDEKKNEKICMHELLLDFAKIIMYEQDKTITKLRKQLAKKK